MFVAFGVFDECRLKGVVVVSAACLLFVQILFIAFCLKVCTLLENLTVDAIA